MVGHTRPLVGYRDDDSFSHPLEHSFTYARTQAKEKLLHGLQAQQRAREDKLRRHQRTRVRGKGDEQANAEMTFALGLADTCPRCGLELEGTDNGLAILHLATCEG